MIGAFPDITKINFASGLPGEPLGAFVAAYVAVEIGALVSGKTNVSEKIRYEILSVLGF